MTVSYPGKYFISHSYRDAAIVEALKGKLPIWVKPFIFPPIKVRPDQMVSNSLMDAIRSCHGLIYITGGASDTSFWVAMERDYAIRMGKRVYSFDAMTERLARDKLDALDLRVFHAYSRSIYQDVSKIADMLNKRYFQTFFDLPTSMAEGSFQNHVEKMMLNVKTLGGYVLIYWSKKVEDSPMIPFELDLAMREYPDRVLLVQLDDTPLPKWIRDQIKSENTLKVMEDPKLSYLHKIDDLIVRLYWLIYQNTRKGM